MAIYRVQAVIEVNSVNTANVMHFEELTPGSNPDREAELNDYMTNAVLTTNFGARWKAIASAEAQITCCKIKKVAPAPEGTARVFFDTLSGVVSNDAAPSQLCYVMRIYTNVGSKRGRGRHFFAGIPEDFLDGGNYTPTEYAGVIGDFPLAFNGSGLSTDGTDWAANVYSKEDNLYRNYKNGYVDPIPRNQRDRTTRLCGA